MQASIGVTEKKIIIAALHKVGRKEILTRIGTACSLRRATPKESVARAGAKKNLYLWGSKKVDVGWVRYG